MRMSRVLTGGAVIAAAVAAGTAFTNTNTLEAGTTAGYGTETVSGATVSNTRYNPDAGDPSKLASVVFTANGNLSDTTSTMRLRLGTNATAATSTCVTGAHVAGPPSTTPITCTLDTSVEFSTFDGIALTVVSQ